MTLARARARPNNGPMPIVLYAGGRTRRNHVLHRSLADLARARVPRKPAKRRGLSFTYVPFCRDDSENFYRRAQERYREFGFTEFHCLKIDAPYTRAELRAALSSDVVYLAGGNTFYFLKHLRRSGFLGELRKFYERGGVVAGLSAGAILLTPTIDLAAYPKFDADRNEVGLKDLRALGLVDFEFFPHYQPTLRYRRALESYSRRRENAVFAVPDGGGIVVDGDTTTCFGAVELYFHGMRIPIR